MAERRGRARLPGLGGVEVAWRARGSGPPMLIHNGLVSTEIHWRLWIPHFAGRFTVITWDYPGHGASPPPPATPEGLKALTMEAFADAADVVARAALDGERAPERVPERVIVCGLSMGVQSALEQWRRHPDGVRALVLLCGTPGHPLDRVSTHPSLRRALAGTLRAVGRRTTLVRAAMWPVLRTPLGRELAYLTGGAHRDACPAPLLDELFAHVAGMRPDVATAAMASYFEHDAADVLGSITVPSLVVAGDHDELTPVSCAEEMHRKIRGSSLHVVHGHSHLAQIERPDEVHGVVDRFLAEHRLVEPDAPAARLAQ